jgi:hypothetical protein
VYVGKWKRAAWAWAISEVPNGSHQNPVMYIIDLKYILEKEQWDSLFRIIS